MHSAKAKRPLRKIIVIVLICAIGLGAVGGGGYYYLKNRAGKEVNVFPLTQLGSANEWYDRVQTGGMVQADRMQSVYLSSTQTVTEIYVHEGQQVHVGDPILAFDTTLSEVELERARIKVDQTELEIQDAQDMLKEINSYKIGTPGGSGTSFKTPKPTREPVPTDVPYFQKGSGTAEDPYVFLWSEDSGPIDGEVVKWLLEMAQPTPSPSPTAEPTETPEGTADPDATSTPAGVAYRPAKDSALPAARPVSAGQSVTVPRLLSLRRIPAGGRVLREEDTAEPTAIPAEPTAAPTAAPTAEPTEEPEITEAPADTPEPSGEPDTPEATEPAEREESGGKPKPIAETTATPSPTAEATASPSPIPLKSEYYIVFEFRVNDSMQGDILRVFELRFMFTTLDTWRFQVVAPVYEPTIVPMTGGGASFGGGVNFDGTMYYTAEEIRQMRAQVESTITDKRIELKIAQQELKQLEYEVSNGEVLCTTDGVVKTVLDPDEALETGQAVVLISGGGGYFITGYMSEFDMQHMSVGDTVTVDSYMTGEQLDARITEISQFPTTERYVDYYIQSGNNNTSKYPFTVGVSEDAGLREGNYVNIYFSISGAAAQDSSGFYLESAFLRTEGGRSYVYVEGEDGLLEKRYVTTGKSMNGWAMEVTSGLDQETDYVAFPYGRNVKEGAKTVRQEDVSILWN